MGAPSVDEERSAAQLLTGAPALHVVDVVDRLLAVQGRTLAERGSEFEHVRRRPRRPPQTSIER